MICRIKFMLLVSILGYAGWIQAEPVCETPLLITHSLVRLWAQQTTRFEPKLVERLYQLKNESKELYRVRLLDSMLYSVEAGGKRFRPFLIALLAQYYGLEAERVDPLAIAVEELHTASLVFDDFPQADDAELRRGIKTNHLAFGLLVAEMAGVSLISEAAVDLSLLRHQGFDPFTVLEVIDYCFRKISWEAAGQLYDVLSKEKTTIQQHARQTYLKTGMGMESGIVSVAILAKASDADIEIWTKYSQILGQMFQISDDILDATKEATVLGKDANQDEKNGTVTYISLYGEGNQEKGILESKRLLEQLRREALEELKNLPGNTEIFSQLLDYMISRKK